MGSTSKNPPFSSSQNSSDSLNGLKFGQKIYFEDVGIAAPAKSGGGSSSGAAGKPPPAPAKKVSGGGQPPRCQVEGCLMDLSDAKAYYGRHKVCGVHSKTPKVVVNGLEQRFCQQCSRFHQLSEFDQGKRSCRRRLAGHNERRRKPSPGTLFSPPYGRLSSSIFETSKGGGGFLMDFSTYPKLTTSDTWPTSRPNHPTPMAQMVHSTTANNPSFPQGANNPSFAQGGTRYPAMVGPTIPSGECFTGGLNSGCALSLLSNQTQWVPQEMAHMVHSTMATTIATHANYQFDQHEMPRQHLGASHEDMPRQHMSQHGDDHYVGSTQQHAQYVELEHSRAFDSSTQFMNWSL